MKNLSPNEQDLGDNQEEVMHWERKRNRNKPLMHDSTKQEIMDMTVHNITRKVRIQ